MSNPINFFIVDDDEVFQFTIRIILKTITAVGDITVFYNGLDAINFILNNVNNQTDLPDVIFLDINMPVMDGFQFMEEYIKITPKLDKKITIYMISSSVDPIDIEKAKEIKEITNYIIKPIRENQLMAIIGELVKN